MKVKSTTITTVLWSELIISAVAGKIAQKKGSILAAEVCIGAYLAAGITSVVCAGLIFADRIEY